MRVAFKLAYLGTGYHGFQVQPGLATVEGCLIQALRKLGLADSCQSAGRTDRGVHALGQVVSFNTAMPELALPRIVNSLLPGDIRVWARAEVPLDFDPRRHAIYRHYRYLLPDDGYNLERVKRGAALLLGEHDFSGFATPDNRNSVCRLETVEVERRDGIVVFDFYANRFLWHMVRKIVAALALVGKGDREPGWLLDILAGEKRMEEKMAEAGGLILMEVGYQGVKWEVEDYTIQRVRKQLEEKFWEQRVLAEAIRELARNLK